MKKQITTTELKNLIKEGVQKLMEEEQNYMFFQNLNQMKKQIDALLQMNPEEIDSKISNGHDWAGDHIATAKDDIEEVFNFFNNNEMSEGDGLWANIHAKRKRGEAPSKKGDKDYPEKKNWDELTSETLSESIPDRYKDKGFTKVGAKKQAPDGAKHKWEVLAKKGDSYKIVKGGHRGMDDYSQHGSKDRKKAFWDRMGGKDSAKAKDPFSALYWHKRFGTW